MRSMKNLIFSLILAFAVIGGAVPVFAVTTNAAYAQTAGGGGGGH
jgi:hypothetical protein